ncbi:ABC transporter ATP-binding protein [Tamaricihabitans halophyticus]|nr:ABC transporter ATP-binding protein [Tamaricihabitans halophyticus]
MTVADRKQDGIDTDAGVAAVELRGIRKKYGKSFAVDGVDLRVADGEFLTLLGPSGCGKTTLLSLIAGFLQPDEGDLLVGGESMTNVAPHRRPVNTVFQDYALFPHMSVCDNVAFGLRMEGVPRRKARQQAVEALEGVALDTHAERRPAELSGGQRQRVALARALVKKPQVLLLDEPFAALDLQLRRRMQLELRALHRQSGTTFVFVTHDQDEAAVLSDRVVVLRDGQIEQLGTPAAIYDHPASRFVAEFIGESNVFDAARQTDGSIYVDALDRTVPNGHPQGDSAAAEQFSYAVRPERILLRSSVSSTVDDDAIAVPMTVREAIRVGETTRVLLELPSGRSLTSASSATSTDWRPGDEVVATWRPDDGNLLTR